MNNPVVGDGEPLHRFLPSVIDQQTVGANPRGGSGRRGRFGAAQQGVDESVFDTVDLEVLEEDGRRGSREAERAEPQPGFPTLFAGELGTRARETADEGTRAFEDDSDRRDAFAFEPRVSNGFAAFSYLQQSELAAGRIAVGGEVDVVG